MGASDHPPESSCDRFAAVYARLVADGRWWMPDTSWLRFAAQTAITMRGEPGDVAVAIHRMALSVRRGADRPDATLPALQLMAAAMLVQAGRAEASFAAEMGRVRCLLHEYHLDHGGLYEVLAILLLWLLNRSQPIPRAQIAKLALFHAHCERHHAWLVRPQTLPVTASLATIPAEPTAIIASIENTTRRLQHWGIPAHFAVEQTAYILALGGAPMDRTIERYIALAVEFRRYHATPFHVTYAAIAALALLDVPVGTATAMTVDAYHQLANLHPHLPDTVRLGVAIDIAYGDLVHQDRRRARADPGSPTMDGIALVHAGQAAAIIASWDSLFGQVRIPQAPDIDVMAERN